MTYKEFTVYVSRIRRKKNPLPPQDREESHSRIHATETSLPSTEAGDPFQNLRTQREKKRIGGFEFDPFSDNKDLID